jgi:NADP-dependent 3-hydroxy acid dehydrogenase YdfG
MKTKCAVIVGASRGIGQAIACTLARTGYVPILVGRARDGLDETAAMCREHADAKVVVGDITSDLSRVGEEIRALTSEVNFFWLGAAGYSEEPVSTLAPITIRDFIRSGFESLVEMTHVLYPMLAEGRAHVVGACSDWSDFRSGGPSVFGSTKVALAGFLDKLRDEVKGDGIRVTALKMGSVGNLEGYGLADLERQQRETGTRLVALQDVCDAIEFILSRKTGTVSEMTLLPADLGR